MPALASMITAIQLIEKFKKEILHIGQLAIDEFDNEFSVSLNKYLDNQFDLLYSTKTFLFRDEKIPFYDAFFPVRLSAQSQTVGTDNITDNLFLRSNYITILGNAGSGKTMLMKHLFINSYRTFYRIPILIELRHLNEFDGNVIDYIYSELLENKVAPSKKILERALQSGKFLFLFDGYDEIYSTNKKKITKQIEAFVNLYSLNSFVISSRPGADAESLTRFDNFFVEELNDDEIKEFTTQQLKLKNDEGLANKIVSSIDKIKIANYDSYLRNPLLLSMFILTFGLYPELPKSKSKFYWNVYDTLITKHDSFSKKAGFQHERKTGLQNEDFEIILKWFSYKSLLKGKYSFDKQFFVEILKEIKEVLKLSYDIEHLIYDLTVSTSLIVIDGLEFKFPHRSFQEYFSASLIKDLGFESKKAVYEKQLKVFSMRASETGNLWDLCYELDKSHFLELFAVPILKSTINSIKDKDDVKQAEKFLEETNFTPLIVINNAEASYYLSYSVFASLNNELLRYMGISFNNFVNQDEFILLHDIEYIKDLINSKYTNKSGFVFHEDETSYDLRLRLLLLDSHEVIKQINFVLNVKGFLKDIYDKIRSIENEIAEERAQTVSLLDI